MRLISLVLLGLFSLNALAAATEFTHVYNCTPANPGAYIVNLENPQNLSFVDGIELARALTNSGNKILEAKNVLLTYLIVQTSDLEALKTILKPYLSKTEIAIECDSPGGLE